jgi:hypothetical protein
MCCFSRSVEHVSGTQIFARPLEEGRQALVYSMTLLASEPLAMILPLPVPVGCGDDAVRFVDLSGYPDFFADLRRAVPGLGMPAAKGAPLARAQAAVPKLQVHDVGLFEASFVPSLRDFERLDERFRLPADVADKMPFYSDYGFAVFRLKPKKKGFFSFRPATQTIHPMAFTFPRRNARTLFFPTLHVHDGEVHPRAAFDHTLYCQPDPLIARTFPWTSSAGPLKSWVDAGRARGLIDPDAPCYGTSLWGELPNEDVILDPPVCAGIEVLEATGECFVLRLRATAAYGSDPSRPGWRATAREGMDRVHDGLSGRVSALTAARRERWGLSPHGGDVRPFWPYRFAPDRGGLTPLVSFHVFSDAIEPQEVVLSFAALPSRETEDEIQRELQTALDEVLSAMS